MEGMEVDTEREGARDVETRWGEVGKVPWQRGSGDAEALGEGVWSS